MEMGCFKNQSVQVNPIINLHIFRVCDHLGIWLKCKDFFHLIPSSLLLLSKHSLPYKIHFYYHYHFSGIFFWFLLGSMCSLSSSNGHLVCDSFMALKLFQSCVICALINPPTSCGEWKFLNGRDSAARLPGSQSQLYYLLSTNKLQNLSKLLFLLL